MHEINHVSFGRDESKPVQPVVAEQPVPATEPVETFPETASPDGQDVAPVEPVLTENVVPADTVDEGTQTEAEALTPAAE